MTKFHLLADANASALGADDDRSNATTGSRAHSRTSTVLQKNIKLYGPRNMLDDSSQSWNSEGVADRTNQWILLNFNRTVLPKRLQLQWQAGFAAESCQIQRKVNDEWEEWTLLEMEDVHDLQTFELDDAEACTALRLTLSEFTDFYGRVIVYQLLVLGTEE